MELTREDLEKLDKNTLIDLILLLLEQKREQADYITELEEI